jgi:DeoR family transcriptional regulator of aga operon
MALRDIRLRQLHEDVVRKGSVQVAAMARDHQVSQETIRRDLDRLADLGLIVRTRGGAVAPGSSLTELDVHLRAQEHRAEKRAIARAVAERLVAEGTSLALDTGSTVLEVARALRSRRLTVVTSSLPVINELVGTACSVVVLGGNLRARSLSTVGPMAERAAEQFHCDLAFVSAPAMTPELGPMDTDLETIEIKRALIRGADRVYAVVDHSKLGKTAFSTICTPSQLTGLVTDDGADPSILGAFQAAGLEIIVGVRTHD